MAHNSPGTLVSDAENYAENVAETKRGSSPTEMPNADGVG